MNDDLIHVLYVDDERDVLEIGKRFLEKSGEFAVDTCPSVLKAFNHLKTVRYDAIISDYQMPEMDGIEFLKNIRSEGNSIPFIIFTGRGREEIVIDALNAGADFYLQKGNDLKSVYTELIHKIQHSISKRQVDQALKKSECNYRNLIENAREAIAVVQDDEFKMFNPQCVKISGYSENELLTNPFTQFLHPEDRDQVFEQYSKRINGENIPSHNPFRLIRKDGTIRWVDLNSIAIIWEDRPATLNFLIDITEQKNAEDALRDSKALYHEFFKTSLDSLFFTTLDGKWFDFNDSLIELFGYETREEMLQIPVISVYAHQENRDYFTKHIEQKGYIKEYPAQGIKKDGTIFDVLITAVCRRNEDGSVKGYLGTIRDITEYNKTKAQLLNHQENLESQIKERTNQLENRNSDLKREIDERYRIEDELRQTLEGIKTLNLKVQESEAKFRSLAESINEGITRIDRNHRHQYVNHSMKLQTGINIEDFIDKTHRELGFPDTISDELEKMIDSVFDTGMKIQNEFLLPNGIRVEINTVPEYSSNDEIKHVIMSGRDITDRKRMENELKESEERYRRIIETAQEGIIILDPQYHIISINGYMAELLEYSQDEMQGRPLIDFLDSSELTSHEHITEERKRGISGKFERLYRTKNGKKVWGLVSSTPIFKDNGFAGAFAMVTDITERKRAEEAIRQVNRKLNLLSSITRHDIKNQVSIIDGFLAIIKKKQLDPSIDYYLQKVTNAAERISSMIQFTREYEKIGVNSPVWHNIRTLVDSAITQTPSEQGYVKNDISADIEVFSDPLIIKVFYNLMDNSIRYGGKITTIRFSAKKHENNYILIFEDDGTGIPEEEREKIFEYGYGKNTGLGLFLSREILAITGLTIKETGEPGQGARFEIIVSNGMWRFIDD